MSRHDIKGSLDFRASVTTHDVRYSVSLRSHPVRDPRLEVHWSTTVALPTGTLHNDVVVRTITDVGNNGGNPLTLLYSAGS